MRALFAVLMISCTLTAKAQWDKYLPTAVRVGFDAGNFAAAFFDEHKRTWEVSTDIDIYRYFLAVDYGYARFIIDDPASMYESTGNYIRIGPEVNFLKNDKDNNVLFFGIKYASAVSSENLQYRTSNTIQSNTGWPESELETSNNNISANWFEMNAGLKAKIINQLYLGFTIRYRILPSFSGRENLTPYYVPGFGKNIDSDSWGLSYYISYRIPFRKKQKNYIQEAIERQRLRERQEAEENRRNN